MKASCQPESSYFNLIHKRNEDHVQPGKKRFTLSLEDTRSRCTGDPPKPAGRAATRAAQGRVYVGRDATGDVAVTWKNHRYSSLEAMAIVGWRPLLLETIRKEKED